MSTAYLRITFSNILIGGGYSAPPHTVYLKYPIKATTNVIGTSLIQIGDDPYVVSYEIHDTWLGVGLPIRIRYRTYYGGGVGSFYNADLATSENADFLAAVQSGNLSGNFVDNDNVTWHIRHVNQNGEILLPSGIGGGEDGEPTEFTESTPTEQAGGEPESKATTPTPNDGVSGVSVNLAELDWESG